MMVRVGRMVGTEASAEMRMNGREDWTREVEKESRRRLAMAGRVRRYACTKGAERRKMQRSVLEEGERPASEKEGDGRQTNPKWRGGEAKATSNDGTRHDLVQRERSRVEKAGGQGRGVRMRSRLQVHTWN